MPMTSTPVAVATRLDSISRERATPSLLVREARLHGRAHPAHDSTHNTVETAVVTSHQRSGSAGPGTAPHPRLRRGSAISTIQPQLVELPVRHGVDQRNEQRTAFQSPFKLTSIHHRCAYAFQM